MAIVEDGLRNDSEEDNEIEVYVEDDDAEQDSDDSDDDDEEAIEKKITDLEIRVSEEPYNYSAHVELIQTLWKLSELDKWRSAYDRFQQTILLQPDDWLVRLQTEVTLAHSAQSIDFMVDLFNQACYDCYSISIFNLWCSWAMTLGTEDARAQIEEVLKRAGSDPFSGKLFWEARLELEKTKLQSLGEDHPDLNSQKQHVLWVLEEVVSRPLLRGDEGWQPFEEMALELKDQSYVDKVKKQHEAAIEYLNKITPFEDKLLISNDRMEKTKIYVEYIELVKELSKQDKYLECDSNSILRVLYERVSTEGRPCDTFSELMVEYARHAQRHCSRATTRRVLEAGVRRCPTAHTFWSLKIQQAEHEDADFDEVKSIFEIALTKRMESYSHSESLWMTYLEFCRRRTDFDKESDVDRLRRTFRLAWDSLAETWGNEANDCELPLFWAHVEYKRIKDPKQGKEIFEEIFKYGENVTLCKYWEPLLQLESERVWGEAAGAGAGGAGAGTAGQQRLRELHQRALRCVQDYPPTIARLWTNFERLYGHLDNVKHCDNLSNNKIKEWRKNYQTMKDKMIGGAQKGKQALNKKTKFDDKKKVNDKQQGKGKRKSGEGDGEGSGVKRKKDTEMEVDKDISGVKRSHEADDKEDKDNKRQRTDSSSSGPVSAGREACTLFVSNLDFKVNEQNLRDKLSEYGDIVSLRLKAGVKAFGGSICYCQYNNPESVEEAIKHDRTPLDGRPMFLSKYSVNKTKTFKYATTAERNKLFVRNLPYEHCTKEALTKVFDKYGKLKDIRIVTFKDGKPKGLAYIEYEDEASACEALKQSDGLQLGDRKLQVAVSEPPPKPTAAPTPTLGQPKRDAAGGMRRTQLSSFIPSVLQKPSTSKAANGQDNGHDKKPLTNTDFRNMLLK
ncbi:PREDICTED: squamous cell carcinoma antigen recognized by T-cells 3 [Papilio polytes]|uniref:squamous cell carcinoma antigen recognized by T-cells 3 n=1 Tax=Papilio polytes TaxID=76194 RepID=UPI0006763AA0|nr:PREDICTED: squamous cell carcinoma antigen recognized by T-cells 3 [Papilio polytes]